MARRPGDESSAAATSVAGSRAASVRLCVAAAATVLAGLLGSCAGHPADTLAPVETRAAGATEIPILVATMREPAQDPGRLFTGERAERASFADIVVSVPPDAARVIGEVQWPESTPGDPAKQFVALKAERISFLESARRFRERVRAQPGRRVLVFVHGYNTRFDEAVFRFAQIMRDSKAQATPVLFTWPSRGQLLAYGYDRESANYSRDSLERLLSELNDSADAREIVILAHSMGNWVTMEALRQMAIRRGGVPSKITQALLAAPDVDIDVFMRQIAAIGPRRPAFTVFANSNDNALSLAETVTGGVSRLGAVDVSQEPWSSRLRQERIAVVDLTKAASSDAVGHTTFAQSPDVVRAIGTRFLAGQSLASGRAGLGAALAGGATRVVGGAAGALVSAPFALVDEGAREQLDSALPIASRPREAPSSSAQDPACRLKGNAGRLGC
jgi:esterase/lipase superfamily enzyme